MTRTLFPDQGFPLDQIRHTAETVLAAYGELNGNGPASQFAGNGFNRTMEGSAHAVHFIDERKTGDPVSIRLTPDCFGLWLHPLHRIEDSDRSVQDFKGTFHFDSKVDVPRGVDQVDMMIQPGEGVGGCRNGNAPLPFLGHPVHDRVTVMDLADFVGHARIIEDAFRYRCFSRVDMRNDADIPDLRCLVLYWLHLMTRRFAPRYDRYPFYPLRIKGILYQNRDNCHG